MKKFTICVLLIMLLILYNTSKSDYITPGTGKNWTLDSLVLYSGGSVTFSGGAYYLNDDTLTISRTDTLKILLNTTLYFPNAAYLWIKGTLIINPPDSVKFTVADTTLRYRQIILDSANSSVLKKLIFEYANCIRILDCSPLIDSCSIRNNYYYGSGMQSGAIGLFRSNSTISNCKIFNNIRAAIVGGANIANSPMIINNLFYGNNISNYNTSQINLGSGGSTPIIIRNNSILRASTNSGAIAFLPTGGVPSLIIENNIIKNNRYGIALLAGGINAIIKNNIIDSNNTQGNPNLGGSGLNFAGNWTSSSVICSRNTIRWNLWGITIQNTAKPNIGNLYNSDTSDNGFNRIYYNSHNDTTFDLYNNTPDSIKAQNNYWGTTNLDTVASYIFGHHNNPALGVVDYLPIWTLTSISTNYEFIKDFRLFEAYPNPFNPVTNIKFQIPANEFVNLEVFDISGKKIEVLVNGNLKAGVYESKWNAENFSSGIYFYRLSSKNYSDTKKIILLK